MVDVFMVTIVCTFVTAGGSVLLLSNMRGVCGGKAKIGSAWRIGLSFWTLSGVRLSLILAYVFSLGDGEVLGHVKQSKKQM